MIGRMTKTLVVGTGLLMLLGSPIFAAAEDLGQTTTFHALQRLTPKHAALTPMKDAELAAVEGSGAKGIIVEWVIHKVIDATWDQAGGWEGIKQYWREEAVREGETLADYACAALDCTHKLQEVNYRGAPRDAGHPGGSRAPQDAGVLPDVADVADGNLAVPVYDSQGHVTGYEIRELSTAPLN